MHITSLVSAESRVQATSTIVPLESQGGGESWLVVIGRKLFYKSELRQFLEFLGVQDEQEVFLMQPPIAGRRLGTVLADGIKT